MWNDLILPEAGAAAAWTRGEPVSGFILTDDEEELRDRAWRFLMPEQERPFLDRLLANLVRTRVLPSAYAPHDRAAYHASLLGAGARSPASRYRRLSEDAAADLALLGPFAAVAARVLTADAARLKGLQYVRDLEDARARDAVARVAENRCLVAWVRQEAGRRAERYGHAMEQLFIEAPQGEAVAAERVVRAFDAGRAPLDALPVPGSMAGACPGNDAPATAHPPSRGRPVGAVVAKD